MYFVLSIVLILLASLPLIAVFKPKSLVSLFLEVYLLGFSLIVLDVEIAGFLSILNSKFAFLTIQGLEALLFWGIWYARRKPALFFWEKINIITPDFREWKKIWHLLGFGILISIGYVILAWLILNIPPNNSDSMHTHLARVIYWLQQGSFKQLTSYSIFAKIYPFDAQLNVLWTILFTGTDKFVGFIQFIAAFVTAVAIYGIARLLGGKKRHSIILGLLWLTFPLIVFQATSTQFDLVVTALFTISMYFFFSYVNGKYITNLVLSALSLGLSLGTKQTIFFMGPGLLIIVLLGLIKKRIEFKKVLLWAGLTLGFFVFLGSYTYINNIKQYGNPLGPSDHVTSDSLGKFGVIDKITYNPLRFMYQFISFDSMPVKLVKNLIAIKADLFTKIIPRTTIDLESGNAIKEANEGFSFTSLPKFNEDESWFGFVGFILLTTAFFSGIWLTIKQKSPIALGLLILCTTYFFMEVAFRPGWDRYQGRYFIISSALLCPLAIPLFNKHVYSKIFQGTIIIISLLSFFFSVSSNELKPLLSKRKYESKYTVMENTYFPKNAIQSYYRKYSLKYFLWMNQNLPFEKTIFDYSETQLATLGDQNHHLAILEAVNTSVPEDARMGIMLVNGDFDYIFFGRRLTRRLININWNGQLFDKGWIRLQNMDYVLIDHVSEIVEVPAYLELISSVDGWGLYKVKLHN